MSDLPAPTAARLRRARWLDPRLLAGVVLVLGSVVAGATVVAAADDTVPVWAVTADLGRDTALRAEDLVVRHVRLQDGADRYLSVSGRSPAGLVLTRAVGGGELLPASAVGTGDGAGLREVGVTVTRATGLARGVVVDVYSVPEPRAGRSAPARMVLGGVTVAQVEETSRTLGAASGRGVALLLPSARVPALLAAQQGGRVELVKVPQRPGPAGTAAP